MNTGKIKFYNEQKGFGFIINKETGKEIFLHAKGLAVKNTRLKQDDLVSYDEVDGKKGKNAVDVKLIG